MTIAEEVAALEQREADAIAARNRAEVAMEAAEERCAAAMVRAEQAQRDAAEALAKVNSDLAVKHASLLGSLGALLTKYGHDGSQAPTPTPTSDDSLAFLDAPEMPAIDVVELLTHSRRACFNVCRYKHHVRYVLGIQPAKKSEALAFGTFSHDCIEAYWRARQSGADEPFDAMMDVAEAKRANVDAFAYVKALALLARYAIKWGNIKLTVLEVEREFALPIEHPDTGAVASGWMLGGKIDLIIRLDEAAFGCPAGATILVEHKTTGASLDDFREGLVVAGQAGQYTIGARAIGHAVDHVVYDVLVKPKIKPLLATPEADRKYTKATPPKKCKACKGIGSNQVDGVHVPCDACNSTGEIAGEPSRLYASQRTEDESAEDYGMRCSAAIDETPDAYIAQIETPRTRDEMDRFKRDLWDAHQLIQLSKDRRIIDRNTDSCIGKYGNRCEFYDVCTGAASLDDPTLFVRVGAHPELQQTNTTETT